ncbi:MAG TPA: 2-succinyl-6-hydroxy-2,4-cyclohexadiene-1-carboxylate synthase [Roseiflexaceae bacterium]|nr:2-succinyl-6-hydroxy-2,4-cyclohexadiene-1-carboxylate synthase [Roseiflexaceae bacterium]
MRVNDITLYVEQSGAGRPLLLLHGFTGSAATWTPFIDALAPGLRILAPDLIGHGRSESPSDAQRYSIDRCVADLLAILDALQIERADVLGYSMGGRVALHLACAARERVGRLVLESSSPGIADAAERVARVAADEALAESIERDGLAAFVERWERLPLFASQASLPQEQRARLRAQRLGNNPLGLANSLRGMGAGRQPSLWDQLPELDVATLLIAGELDAKYRALAGQMLALLPNARATIVPGAGHTVHLEQSRLFIENVLEFLSSSSSGGGSGTAPPPPEPPPDLPNLMI